MIKITYFVHGTTTDNENDIATGWEAGELSELGIQQSKDLTAQIGNQQFDAVFCSDLKRAVDSARLTFGDDYQIITDERLRECNYGDFNGKPDSFKSDPKQFIEQAFPNGESYTDVETRVKNFLDFLKKDYDGKHIAIVAHQAPQLALEVLLGGKTWPQAIDQDWRHTKTWQPGWKYVLKY
ncbi:MAG: histidine phosphatase family protein [Candidatus Buchananbacteria bacterium]|nr:histidine phosphatase family protein [Candidatus Buchananbacteria bacterium]